MLLTLHVILAALALLLGLGAMGARKRRGTHTTVGLAYFWTVSAVSFTGAAHITGRHGRNSPEAFLIPGTLGSLVLIWLLVGIHRGRLPKT